MAASTTPKRGYIALHRKIQDNFLWKQPREFSKAEAWIDILMEAQHSEKPQKVILDMTALTCNYGESLKSITTWAERWTWSRSKVYRFFELLQKCGMIVTKSEQITTRLTVCNYRAYDPKQNVSETQVKRKRNASETEADTDNKEKKDKKDNNEKDMSIFDEARRIYQGTKRGLETEFGNFIQKHKDWKKVLPLLKPAVEWQIMWRKADGQWWKNFKTWINNRCWEEEAATTETPVKPIERGSNGLTARERAKAQMEKENAKQPA